MNPRHRGWPRKVPLSYLLPVKWHDGSERGLLTAYLRGLSKLCDQVIVVDGSPAEVFDANAAAWPFVTHLRPNGSDDTVMGKVAGVRTGARVADRESVLIADDDVRFDLPALERVASLLEDFDLVRPQNYFDPLPPHALWDSARILLNRGLGGDFPGTLGVRRSFLLDPNGYLGDVLFENLDLMRTVEARDGAMANAMDVYVRRIPPSFPHFLEQRVRHAYEEFAFPVRMASWLGLLPLLGVCLARRRRWPLLAVGIGSILLSLRGRSSHGGRRIFPLAAALLTPAWLLERGVCAWLAVFLRLAGGYRYHGRTVTRVAHSKRALLRRMRAPGTRAAGG